MRRREACGVVVPMPRGYYAATKFVAIYNSLIQSNDSNLTKLQMLML